MELAFDKYYPLFAELSTRIEEVRKSNNIYQSFFVKHVYIIRPLKSDIIFLYYIYITSINLLFNNKVFNKTYLNDQVVITFVIYVLIYSKKLLITIYFQCFLLRQK